MRRFFAVVLLLFPLFFGCARHDNNPPKPEKNVYRDTSRHDDYNVKIAIPTAWIEKVRHFDYKHRHANLLLREFEKYTKPDSLLKIKDEGDVDSVRRGMALLNPLFINLDQEPGEELVCLMGWDASYPSMAVFKNIAGNWYLVYLEEFYMFYSGPELYVSNSFSPNKTFYFRRVYERGSGVYSDGYSFYKLINNRVYHCLELANEARIEGWGLYINQDVSTSFKFNSSDLNTEDADEIWVNYKYKFFPGAVNEGDCPWCANSDISLIEGEGGVNYIWDNKRRLYKPDISLQQNDPEELTAKKIACFGDFGNDTLFVDAFHDQLTHIAKEGTPRQKAILKKYLALVKKDKVATTQKLKITTQIGGTTFYGPDTAKKK
ncbi:hypothetical protein [Mucilaginibacter ginsenosidivorax]|uniref:Lipoprotein n=1 Tax=Mucilaginibacter ginsenosidivorax TaxID=862126 RepID=A0A5B8W5D0_9SPHI|nr:hypothetical protein [Mucilaginibacter ginsenosidivorax]QEC79270.1 hypothetical protein FSB76_26205 [Mucilaginibacter ginsenosidivorax]